MMIIIFTKLTSKSPGRITDLFSEENLFNKLMKIIIIKFIKVYERVSVNKTC